jgi:hypothetical protein
MRLLKLFEEYVQSKEVINTNVYTLSEHTDTSGEPINKTTDELIDEVIRKLNTIYNRTERNGFRKYTHLYLDKDGNMTFDEEDENGNENENISIRIANHTFNPLRGINDLNVLICNKDETRNKFRFAENDLEYDETDNPDLIVKDIISYF